MDCDGCDRRRREMEVLVKAGIEWARNPTGPSLREITLRLRAEQETNHERTRSPTGE